MDACALAHLYFDVLSSCRERKKKERKERKNRKNFVCFLEKNNIDSIPFLFEEKFSSPSSSSSSSSSSLKKEKLSRRTDVFHLSDKVHHIIERTWFSLTSEEEESKCSPLDRHYQVRSIKGKNELSFLIMRSSSHCHRRKVESAID